MIVAMHTGPTIENCSCVYKNIPGKGERQCVVNVDKQLGASPSGRALLQANIFGAHRWDVGSLQRCLQIKFY